jgi:hypothetical protein
MLQIICTSYSICASMRCQGNSILFSLCIPLGHGCFILLIILIIAQSANELVFGCFGYGQTTPHMFFVPVDATGRRLASPEFFRNTPSPRCGAFHMPVLPFGPASDFLQPRCSSRYEVNCCVFYFVFRQHTLPASSRAQSFTSCESERVRE